MFRYWMYVWFILTFVGCALHNCYRICMWSHQLNIVLFLTLTLLSLRVWWDGLWMVLICTSLSLDADYEHVWIPQLLLVIGCTVDVEKTQWVKVMEKKVSGRNCSLFLICVPSFFYFEAPNLVSYLTVNTHSPLWRTPGCRCLGK